MQTDRCSTMICSVMQRQHCKTRAASVSHVSVQPSRKRGVFGQHSIHALGARRLNSTRHVGLSTHNQQQRVVSASVHTTRAGRSLAGGVVDPVNSVRITGKVLKSPVEYQYSNDNPGACATLVLGVKWFAGAQDEEIDHIKVLFWKSFKRRLYESALQIQEGTTISVVGNIRPSFDIDATGRRFNTITVSASQCRIVATGQGSAAAYCNEVAITGTVCDDPLVEKVDQAWKVTVTLEVPRYWKSSMSHIVQVYFWGVEGDDEMCNQASRLLRGARVDVLAHLVTSYQGTGQNAGPSTVQLVGDAVKLAAHDVSPLRGPSMQHLMRNMAHTTIATAAAPTSPLEKIFGDDLLNTDAFLTSFCRGRSIAGPAMEDEQGAHGGADVTRPSIIGYMRSSDEGPFTPVYGRPGTPQPRLPFLCVQGQVATALLQAPSIGLHCLNPDTTNVYIVGRDSLPHLSYDLPPKTPSITDYAYPTDATDITEEDTVFVLALESGPRLLFLYAKSGLLGTNEQVDDLAARYLQGKQYFTASQRSLRKEFTEGSTPQIYISGYRTDRTTREFGRYRKETLSEAGIQAIDGLSSTLAEKLHAAMPVAMEGVRQQGIPPATLGGSPFTSLSITEQYYNPIHVDENDVGEGLVLWLLVGKGLLVGGEFHVSTLRLRFLPGHGAVTFFNTSLLYHGTAPVDDQVSSTSLKRLGSALYVGQGTIRQASGRPPAAEQPKNYPGTAQHFGEGRHEQHMAAREPTPPPSFGIKASAEDSNGFMCKYGMLQQLS